MMNKKTKDRIYGISPKETKQRMQEAEKLLAELAKLAREKIQLSTSKEFEVVDNAYRYCTSKGLI